MEYGRKIICVACGTGMTLELVEKCGSLMKCPTCGVTCLASVESTYDWRYSAGARMNLFCSSDIPIEFF
jgi:hypothetical protein